MPETASPSLRILTLRERSQLLRASDLSAGSIDIALAEKRLARWRAQSPYDRPGALEYRLEKDGLTVEDLRLLLGLVDAATTTQLPASTWSHLVNLWKLWPDGAAQKQTPQGRGLVEEGFALLALPAIAEAEQALRHFVDGLSFGDGTLLGVAESALFEVGSTLRAQIREVTTRTMILEMHVAKAQGLLTAEDPEQRYQEFLLRLLTAQHSLALLEEYAVLAHLLDEIVAGWLRVTSELFERLARDWNEIVVALPELSLEHTLKAIQGGAGDLHRGRRSVHILAFASGAKLVYKPRSLHLDEHFATICRWLKEKNASLDLRIPAVLSREDYGWCSFVRSTPCETREEVGSFYRRLGALLAVLHILQATDFHYENLIADGEYPTPIDLEALLHARLDEGSSTPMGFLRAIQEDSVIRVGLLPRVLFSQEDGGEGIDISGMGGRGGQLSPTKVLVAEAAYTDEMRIVRRQVRMEGSHNQPSIGGESLQVSAFVEQVVDGFTAASEVIKNGLEEWRGPVGLLQNFAQDRLRLVVRPTMIYAKTLHEGYHPNLMRDAVDRDRLFERLWLGCVQRKQLEPFFPAEMRDLTDGEVPAFFFRPDSRQVWDAADQPLGDLLEQPTLHLAQAATDFQDKDLQRQQWWIRATLAASQTTGLVLGSCLKDDQPPLMTLSLVEPFLKKAAIIGDRLLAIAERHGEWLHWHGLHYYRSRWNAGPVGVDLYNGSAGIGLFLAHLGSATGESSYNVAARAALQTSVDYLHQLRSMQNASDIGNVGAFWGESGLSLCLHQVGDLWHEPALMEQAAELMKSAILTAKSCSRVSVGAGTAGFVLSVVSTNTSDTALIDALEPVSDALMRKLENTEVATELDSAQCSWLDGWCGVGHTLVLAGHKLGNSAMVETGVQAFHRGLKAGPNQKLASPSQALDIMLFGPDSGLIWKAMLDIEKQYPGAINNWQIPRVEQFSSHSARSGMSLHHGACAQIDLLLELHLHAPAIGFLHQALSLSTKHLLGSWECGTPSSVETPGLMVGLAGIGETLLRCGAPHAARLFRTTSRNQDRT